MAVEYIIILYIYISYIKKFIKYYLKIIIIKFINNINLIISISTINNCKKLKKA